MVQENELKIILPSVTELLPIDTNVLADINTPVSIGNKFCPLCKLIKPLEDFYVIRVTYHVNKCKDCFKAIMNIRNKLTHTLPKGRPRIHPVLSPEENKKCIDDKLYQKIKDRLTTKYNVKFDPNISLVDIKKLAIKTAKVNYAARKVNERKIKI